CRAEPPLSWFLRAVRENLTKQKCKTTLRVDDVDLVDDSARGNDLGKRCRFATAVACWLPLRVHAMAVDSSHSLPLQRPAPTPFFNEAQQAHHRIGDPRPRLTVFRSAAPRAGEQRLQRRRRRGSVVRSIGTNLLPRSAGGYCRMA